MIADQLTIAVSTVHTHFKRAREKLDLPSLEALISFAARHSETFPHLPSSKPARSDRDSSLHLRGNANSIDTSTGTASLRHDDSHVLICDWMGRLTWSSKEDLYQAYGDLAWNYVPESDRDKYREAFSRATTLRRRQQIDASCIFGGRYRGWLWPLDWPDAAVCILAMRIPNEMALLTPREHESLKLLSRGATAGQLAKEMDVSASTIHTLLRRARVKLKLKTSEELMSFAARYCFPNVGPLLPLRANENTVAAPRRERARPVRH
jgi:DNA-binding CsgD family transcriptional regulator